MAAAVHTALAAETFSVYEANLLPNALRSELPLEPIPLEDGQFVPTSRPGHGCEPNWELLKTYDIRSGLYEKGIS